MNDEQREVVLSLKRKEQASLFLLQNIALDSNIGQHLTVITEANNLTSILDVLSINDIPISTYLQARTN